MHYCLDTVPPDNNTFSMVLSVRDNTKPLFKYSCLHAPRNFGKIIVTPDGVCCANPSVKTPKWSDVLAAVPRWFAKFAEKGKDNMPNKIYTFYSTIAPTQKRGWKPFMKWLKELVEMVENPLPVE